MVLIWRVNSVNASIYREFAAADLYRKRNARIMFTRAQIRENVALHAAGVAAQGQLARQAGPALHPELRN
jgi:hypothetical protein